MQNGNDVTCFFKKSFVAVIDRRDDKLIFPLENMVVCPQASDASKWVRKVNTVQFFTHFLRLHKGDWYGKNVVHPSCKVSVRPTPQTPLSVWKLEG